MTFYNM